MDQLSSLGTSIAQTVGPTFKVYAPLLGAARSSFAVPQTFRYSQEAITRHELDVYLPAGTGAKSPVMVFVHGGGMNKGDKQLPLPGAHQNVGTFFSKRGFVTVRTFNWVFATELVE
jgi:carboxylesterase type B